MSLLSIPLTVPPNTPEYAPIQAIRSLTVRRLISVSVLFPAGCMGAVGVHIMDGGQQIAPLSGWLHGNNETLSWTENRQLRDNLLIVEGYSLAEDWSHSLEIRLIVEKI